MRRLVLLLAVVAVIVTACATALTKDESIARARAWLETHPQATRVEHLTLEDSFQESRDGVPGWTMLFGYDAFERVDQAEPSYSGAVGLWVNGRTGEVVIVARG